MTLKHFSLSEFDSPDSIGSGSNMNHEFLRKLDLARDLSQTAFIITSGYRTIRHNSSLRGAVSNSSHLIGRAADILVTDNKTRGTILYFLLRAGFNRFGIGPDFIHVDDDPAKTPGVTWLY